MTENLQSDRTRRTFIKGAAAAGVAATGISAFTTSGAAQETPISVDGLAAEDGSIDVQDGNPNGDFEELSIEFDDVEFDQELGEDDLGETVTGTGSGTVTGSVLPNGNANGNATQEIDTSFEDVSFEAVVEEVEDGEEVGNPVEVPEGEGISELVRLELDGLFLDVLGLQVDLSEVILLVTADPEGGLLGELLAGLGREV